MVSPSLLLIAIVAAYPIGYAVWLSLHEYSVRVAGLSRWAGFKNYSTALQSSEFWDAVKTTFIFTGASVVLETLLGLAWRWRCTRPSGARACSAPSCSSRGRCSPSSRRSCGRRSSSRRSGFVNSLLGAIGLPSDTVWLGESPQALMVMIFADTWKTAPFMALLLLAGLQVIPDDIYEAAKVDGATTWQRFTRITLPLLKPALLVALIFRTLDALRIFDLPFVLTKGAHGTTTLSLDLVSRPSRPTASLGLGSALAVLTFIIVMIVSFVYIRFVGGNIRGLAED